MTRRLGALLVLVAAACIEQSTAPGVCPNYCPTDSIRMHDTLFSDIIERDSSFRGYLSAYQAPAMTAADLAGIVDSRAFFVTDTVLDRLRPKSGDTTSVPKVMDSVRVRFVIVGYPRNTTSLRLKLYRLPVTIDSSSNFDSLDASFTAAPVDSLDVNELLASPQVTDTQTVRIWGDTIRVDAAGHVLQISKTADSSLAVYFNLDTVRAPFSSADTGRVAWGIRVSADPDSMSSIALGTIESGANAPLVRWFYHFTNLDSLSTVVDTSQTVANRFDSFVFNPPNPAIDLNLTIGGVPSARSIIRVAMPAFLHDTLDIVRATLILVPVNTVPGSPRDSFRIVAKPVVTDLGAKSPLSANNSLYDTTVVHTGSADTVRLELTNLVRAWALDTTIVTTFFLGQVPEATSFTEARFYSTRAPGFKPALQVTYVSHFAFGKP